MTGVPDPFTPLGQAAAQARELYETFREQGFEPRASLYLVAAIITRSPGGPPSSVEKGDE